MPKVEYKTTTDRRAMTYLSIQGSGGGSATPFGLISLALWGPLLGVGLWSLLKSKQMRFVLGFGLLGQLALHLLYGAEIFLYAAHYGPLLVAVAALGTLTRFRKLVLTGTAALIVCVAINNITVFRDITSNLPVRKAMISTTNLPLATEF
jgi:hypothetical protein